MRQAAAALLGVALLATGVLLEGRPAETAAQGGPPAGPGPILPQAPLPAGGPPISAGDRVYAADQSSNTVSIIDPTANTLLGTLALGNPRPNLFAPIYYREVNAHGLGFSPDGRLLAVINVTTNGVTLIRTATNEILGTVYVGRAPHEGFFTPDGREFWVVVRGEDYISVIDPYQIKEVRRVKTMLGPGMVLFSPDGRYAYVNSSRVPEFNVVDTKRYQVIARLPVVSPFSPDIAVSPDGAEAWITHKDVGKVTAIDIRDPKRPKVIAVLDTGRVTNHVNFVSNATGDFAYVTIGGENKVVVIRRGTPPQVVGSIPAGPTPHGLWPSPDGTRLYVALEDGDAVQVIDTLANRVIATIPSGQAPQALVYVRGAVPQGDGRAKLGRQGLGHPVVKFGLVVPDKPFAFLPAALPSARGVVVARRVGDTDEVSVSVEGLPGQARYLVFLTERPTPPFGAVQYLADITTDASGRGAVLAYARVFDAFALTGVASDGRLNIQTTEATRKPLGHVVIWPAAPATLASVFSAHGLAAVTGPFGPEGKAGSAILTDSTDPAASTPFGRRP